MSAAASALLVTADKALASELARLLMARKLSLQVVGTKSSDVDLAARLLGVSRRTLYNKLEEHGLE